MRRTIGILATAAAISLAVVAPAPAQTPQDINAAAATATALQITLLGQQLAVSQTQAALSNNDGTPVSAADGAALLLAGTPVPGAAPSAYPAGPADNAVCPLELDLGEATGGALSGLQLEIACLRTFATGGDAPLGARSESGEVVLRVLAPGGTILQPILEPVLGGLQQVTEPLVQALEPLLGVVTDVTQIDVATVLDELIDDLGNDLFVLAEVVVAPSVSQVDDTVDGVSAEAGSNAVTINILPGIASAIDTLTNLIDAPAASNAPLLQVKLGAANSRVVKNLDGETIAEAGAAQLLSITADDSLGILQGLTGQLTDVLDLLAINELNCETGALADILCIELGRVNELDQAELTARNMNFGPGTVGIESAAATVRVLPIAAAALGGDVLGLSLASTTVAANANDEARVAPPAPEVPAAAPLPKTGAESALPITLALLAVGAAGVAMVRRARTV